MNANGVSLLCVKNETFSPFTQLHFSSVFCNSMEFVIDIFETKKQNKSVGKNWIVEKLSHAKVISSRLKSAKWFDDMNKSVCICVCVCVHASGINCCDLIEKSWTTFDTEKKNVFSFVQKIKNWGAWNELAYLVLLMESMWVKWNQCLASIPHSTAELDWRKDDQIYLN